MLEGGKTDREIALEQRIADKEVKIRVVSRELDNGKAIEIDSNFDDIERALHKIKLDILVNVFYGFKNPILVFVEAK